MGNDHQHSAAPAVPAVLDHVDLAKRAWLHKVVIGTVYAVPAIASFSLAGISTSAAVEALAYL